MRTALLQAVSLYGEAIKSIMNEEFGDGIMSAIDMYATVAKIEGKGGEARVCVTLNGKVSIYAHLVRQLGAAWQITFRQCHEQAVREVRCFSSFAHAPRLPATNT